MKILVSEKYAINVSSDGFTLVKLSTPKEGKNAGKTLESFVGYYPRIDQVARRILINNLADDEDVVVIGELANNFDEAVNKIVKAIENGGA